MTRDAQNPLDPADRDPLLSAHALGQLDAAERAAVERLLADPAAEDARRIVAESRAVADALRTAAAHDAPPRSADLRRAIVARLAEAPVTTALPPRGSRTSLSGWLALAGALAATVLVALTVAPSMQSAREVARRAARAPQPEPAEPTDVMMPTAGAGRADTGSADRLVGKAGRGKPNAEEQGETRMEQRRPTDAPAGERLARAAGTAVPYSGEPRTLSAPAAAPEQERGGELAANHAPAPIDAKAKADPGETLAEGVLLDGTQQFNAADGEVGRRQLAAAAAPRRDEGLRLRVAQDKESADYDDDASRGPVFYEIAKDRATRERYARFEENRFLAVADRPLSTFSIDVDTASYAVVRRFLAAGHLPPADAVRIEEFVNYFRYSYPRPDGDDPFAVALEAADCPWHAGHRLVRVGIAGRDIDRAKRPSGNLVFLIDVSGSMGEPDKLPLVKQALAMLVEELTENDRVSIVTYAGDAGLKLPPTSGDQKRRIREVIDALGAGGSTHGSAGIELAYAQAAETFIRGGANRVILCTDGDLNVGITSDAALVELVQEKARGGTFLTVLGFGRGNLQDEKMEKLADKGNGVYAYVDGVREARKVLVEQLTGSTIAIAKDVKIQVEFNPAQVASYRLLGYENRKLADADFRDDKKDAGEIGAGHTVTALYEIVPAGGELAASDGPGAGAEPLKYQPQAEKPRAAEPAPAAGSVSRELLTVKLRFKQPEGDVSVLREFPLADHGGGFAAATADTRFAAAVAAFGMLLRHSEFKGEATLPMVAQIAGAALGTDDGGYRAEFLDLVRKAEALQPSHDR